LSNWTKDTFPPYPVKVIDSFSIVLTESSSVAIVFRSPRRNRFKLTKKLVKESVVYRRTALFQGNLDGRLRPQVTQDIDSKTRETEGTRVGNKVLKEAAVRTTWVESPVTYPSDLVLIQLTSRHEKSAKVIFH
jgi:hypothetical protein